MMTELHSFEIPKDTSSLRVPIRKKIKKKTVRKKVTLPWFLLILFIASQIIFLTSSLFDVNYIILKGNSLISKKEIYKNLVLPKYKNIFFFNKKIFVAGLYGIPWIENVTAKFSFPSAIRLFITERKILGFVAFMRADKKNISEKEKVAGKKNDSEKEENFQATWPDKWYIIGDRGVVLNSTKFPDRLRIIDYNAGFKDVYPEEKIEKANMWFKAFGNNIKYRVIAFVYDKNDNLSVIIKNDKNSDKESVNNEENKFDFNNVNKFYVNLGEMENIDVKIASLENIVEILKDKNVEVIDLRFENPVVRFKK